MDVKQHFNINKRRVWPSGVGVEAVLPTLPHGLTWQSHQPPQSLHWEGSLATRGKIGHKVVVVVVGWPRIRRPMILLPCPWRMTSRPGQANSTMCLSQGRSDYSVVSKQTWCLTSTETMRLIRDGEKGGGGEEGMEVGEREIIYLPLHCHHQNDFCIKMSWAMRA